MTHIIMSIILVLVSFQVGCASRQYAIYPSKTRPLWGRSCSDFSGLNSGASSRVFDKINVERHIEKNFDSSTCGKNGKHRYRVKINSDWLVVSIEAEKGTPADECSKNLRRAIQASSPLPEAPPLVQGEAIAEGFNIGI